tara:strand:- start:15 stop:1346 length:1332 start_codon:yes stop_codon:yes gene_type:complete
MDNVNYSGAVKNTLLDPVLDVKNGRSEFRIMNDETNRVLLPNLRLFLGVSCANSPHYNFVAGAGGLIRNIFLMDGNVVLDQCRNANGWLAFQNYLGFNDENASKFSAIQQKVIGYSVQGQLPANDTAAGNDDDPSSDQIYRTAQGTITNNADSFTNAGYLDLKRVLPMLSSVEGLPLSVFSSGIRIVIEYETDANKILSNTQSASTTIRPIISYDELTDDADKKAVESGFKGAQWDSIVHDLVVVPKATANNVSGFNPAANNSRGTQEINANVKNYRGKYLKKLLVAKNPTETAVFKAGNVVSPMGAYASVTSINEAMNVKINGAPKLPLDCDRPNKRLALLSDTWGNANAYPLNASFGADKSYNILRPFDNASSLEKQVGVQDYFGLDIEDQVKDMQLKFVRTVEGSAGNNSESYHSQLNLNMWGLCPKQIVVKAGGYNVVG